MIKKTKQGWKVVSHTTGRSFGTYSTKPKAEKRLRQIKMFGKMKKKKKVNEKLSKKYKY